MSDTLVEPRWRRRSDARPQEVLTAALEAFVERGYAATAMDDIARRAGVSKGTLYLYYPGKSDLLKAVVRHALLGNLAEAQMEAAKHQGSSWELLAFFLGEFTRRISRTGLSGLPKLILSESGNFPEITRFYYDEVIQRARRLIVEILQRGVASGEFRAIPVDYAWQVIVAPLVLGVLWKHTFEVFADEPLDFENYLCCQRDMLAHALLAKPPQAPRIAEEGTTP